MCHHMHISETRNYQSNAFWSDRTLRYPEQCMLLMNWVLVLTRTLFCSPSEPISPPQLEAVPFSTLCKTMSAIIGDCRFYSQKSDTQHNLLQNIHLYMLSIQPYYKVHTPFRNNSGLKLNNGLLRTQVSFRKGQLRHKKAGTSCHQPQITSSKEVQLVILAVLAESYNSPPRDSKYQFNDRKIHKLLQLPGMCTTV